MQRIKKSNILVFFPLFLLLLVLPSCNKEDAKLTIFSEVDTSSLGEEKIGDGEELLNNVDIYNVAFRKIEVSIDGKKWRTVFDGERVLDITKLVRVLDKEILLERAIYYHVKITFGKIDVKAIVENNEYISTYSGIENRVISFDIQNKNLDAIDLAGGGEKSMTIKFEVKETVGFVKENSKINIYEPGIKILVQ